MPKQGVLCKFIYLTCCQQFCLFACSIARMLFLLICMILGISIVLDAKISMCTSDITIGDNIAAKFWVRSDTAEETIAESNKFCIRHNIDDQQCLRIAEYHNSNCFGNALSEEFQASELVDLTADLQQALQMSSKEIGHLKSAFKSLSTSVKSQLQSEYVCQDPASCARKAFQRILSISNVLPVSQMYDTDPLDRYAIIEFLEHVEPQAKPSGRCLEWGRGYSDMIFSKSCAIMDAILYSEIAIPPQQDRYGHIFHENILAPVHLPQSSYDLIIATQLLEHIRDPLLALQNMLTLLTPGGHVVVTVPFACQYHPGPDDFYRFTHSGIAHLVQLAGFDIIELKKFGNIMTTTAIIQGIDPNHMTDDDIKSAADDMYHLVGVFASKPVSAPA